MKQFNVTPPISLEARKNERPRKYINETAVKLASQITRFIPLHSRSQLEAHAQPAYSQCTFLSAHSYPVSEKSLIRFRKGNLRCLHTFKHSTHCFQEYFLTFFFYFAISIVVFTFKRYFSTGHTLFYSKKMKISANFAIKW